MQTRVMGMDRLGGPYVGGDEVAGGLRRVRNTHLLLEGGERREGPAYTKVKAWSRGKGVSAPACPCLVQKRGGQTHHHASYGRVEGP